MVLWLLLLLLLLMLMLWWFFFQMTDEKEHSSTDLFISVVYCSGMQIVQIYHFVIGVREQFFSFISEQNPIYMHVFPIHKF